MPTVQFFEIPADDLERAKKFYNELFGWKIEKEEQIVRVLKVNICSLKQPMKT